MASRLARKVRRTGKTAVQFRFSSKFEYIDLQLNGTWRPDKLRVIWLRSHRRAQTTEVHWVAKTDSGPNGAEGRAVFDPPITAALLVTLYRDAKKTNFDSKEYKYFIENEGPNGKKILASITVDLSEYAGMPSSRHPLELTCKSVSKKVNEAIIGTTIESEFIKQGDSNDDDMQSTFSAISAGQGSIVFDEEDDEDLDEAATMDHSHQSNGILSSTPTKAATAKEDPPPPAADSQPLVGQTSNSTISSSVPPMDLMLLQPSQSSSGSIEEKTSSSIKSSNGASTLKQSETAEPKRMTIINEKTEEDDKGSKHDDDTGAAVPPAAEQSLPVTVTSSDRATEDPQKKEKPKDNKKEEEKTTQQQTQAQTKSQNQAQTQSQTQAETKPQAQALAEPQTKAQTQSQPQAPKQLAQQQAQPHYDFAYEMSMLLAGASSPKSVHSVQSSDSPKSTNPFDSPKTTNPFDEPEEEPATISVRDIWLPGLELVDHNEASVHIERVEKACVIGLYFSAQWCPPCHRFLPRLTKFYNIMKENSRAFEVIYVTSDNTRAEAFKYMEEKQMPWPAIPHGHPLLDKLKEDYKIKSIPMLTIVATSNGEQIDENGKKSVEGAGSPSSAMKLFSKWLEKAGISPEEEVERGKKGLICTVKKAFHACDQPSSRSKSIDKEEHREQVQAAKPRKTKSSSNHDQCAALLLEKDEKIRDLHEKNSALEQTNKDLNEETVELKKKIQDLENRLEFMQKSAHDLEAEQERMKAQTELAGWLCKRGVRGPTANVWRRRYFRLDQGSKLYYYKTGTEGTPQGFIDLLKVVDVNEVSAAQQDKNHATFHVLVEGRTFQLLAIDEPTMKKWMEAITYLKNYYQKRS